MSLAADIADRFRENEWVWKAGTEVFVPDADDVEAALDTAVQALYDEPVDSELEVGRLIIIKRHRCHDVYVYAGEYT